MVLYLLSHRGTSGTAVKCVRWTAAAEYPLMNRTQQQRDVNNVVTGRDAESSEFPPSFL